MSALPWNTLAAMQHHEQTEGHAAKADSRVPAAHAMDRVRNCAPGAMGTWADVAIPGKLIPAAQCRLIRLAYASERKPREKRTENRCQEFVTCQYESS
jgi:hypothetical protein